MIENADGEKELHAALARFHFRDRVPGVCIGTASDRYAGWMGQIYDPARYRGRVKRRKVRIGKDVYLNGVLPIDSVEEYFEHFSILEIDFTFYGWLLNRHGEPTPGYRALERYARFIRGQNRILVKAPHHVSARKLWVKGRYQRNPHYLDSELYLRCFYEPLVQLLGPSLAGVLFQQEYQRREDRMPAEEMARDLHQFFDAVQDGPLYHVELRTEAFLAPCLFRILKRHGVGLVLSHWTWLPRLMVQWKRSGSQPLHREGKLVIRLMTPRGVRYEEAYRMAHPFDRLIPEMISRGMLEDTVSIVRFASSRGWPVALVINNRAGGNAPLLAAEFVKTYFGGQRSKGLVE